MYKKILYIICFFICSLVPFSLQAQQASVYRVTRMPFNSGTFNEISPVIVKDGIIFVPTGGTVVWLTELRLKGDVYIISIL